MPTAFILLSVLLIMSSTLASGLFLVFSDFLMRSFRLSEDKAGIEVMQVLNREIFRSITIVLLFGSIPLSIGVAVYAYFLGFGVNAHVLALGAGIYFFGVLIVSYTVNVPMNETLDKMPIQKEETAVYWREDYVDRWVFWNWIRAISAGTTTVCTLIAILNLS